MNRIRRATLLIVLSVLFGLLYAVLFRWLESGENPRTEVKIDQDMLKEYASYPLSKQMELLLEYKDDDRITPYMLTHLARHGEGAYESLLPYLKGDREELDKDLAGQGMMWIHGWGYDLKGSEAEVILQSMLNQGSTRYWLRVTVHEIQSEPAGHSRSAMEANDGLILQEILSDEG